MPTELVFIRFISDNFATELVKKCEKHYWKNNLDRQWQRRREAGSWCSKKMDQEQQQKYTIKL